MNPTTYSLAATGITQPPSIAVRRRRPIAVLRKVGGLWHWRIGRIGGSFYIAKNK